MPLAVFRTLSRVAGATSSGLASARETVEMDTPATRATSRALTATGDTSADVGATTTWSGATVCKRLQRFVKSSSSSHSQRLVDIDINGMNQHATRRKRLI